MEEYEPHQAMEELDEITVEAQAYKQGLMDGIKYAYWIRTGKNLHMDDLEQLYAHYQALN